MLSILHATKSLNSIEKIKSQILVATSHVIQNQHLYHANVKPTLQTKKKS